MPDLKPYDVIARIKDVIPKDKKGNIIRRFREDFDKISKLTFTLAELLQIESQFKIAAEAYIKEKENDREADKAVNGDAGTADKGG